MNLYKGRVPDGEGKPFCTEPTRDRLGTHKVFKGAGPPVIVVFNNTFDLTCKDRKEELRAFNLIEPNDLVEEVKGDNAIQRHFYAQVDLETLLEGWKQSRPDKLHLVGYTDYSDRHRDQMVTLYHQFCLGFQQLGGTPVLVGQKSFRSLSEKLHLVNNVSILENKEIEVPLSPHQGGRTIAFLQEQGADAGIAALKMLA